MTAEAVAKAMHVSRQTVNDWENGKKLPNAARLPQLADLYGTSIDYLLAHPKGVKGNAESSETGRGPGPELCGNSP